MILSFSDLQGFRTCPEQGRLRVLTPRYEKAGPSRVGTAMHGVLQSYVKHCVNAATPTDIEKARDLITKASTHLCPTDSAALEQFAFKALDGLDLSFLDGALEVHVEERVFIDVKTGQQLTAEEAATENRLVFAFTPDLWWLDLQGKLHVLDWKTGWVMEHVDSPDENFQLRAYATGIMMAIGAPQAFGHIYHVRYSATETSEVMDLDAMVPWFREVVERLCYDLAAYDNENRRVDKTTFCTGQHCEECDFRGKCPAYLRHAPVVSEAMSNEDVLGAVVTYGARLDEAKKELRKRVDRDGEISVGKHTTALSVENRGEFLPSFKAKLRELLAPEAVEKLLQPTATRVRQTFKKEGMAEYADVLIEAHREKKLSTVLKIKKAGAGREAEE